MAKTAADFIGLSAGEVTAFLGQPTELEGTTLVYEKNGALWFKLEQAKCSFQIRTASSNVMRE
jgi:hypothetical protein